MSSWCRQPLLPTHVDEALVADTTDTVETRDTGEMPSPRGTLRANILGIEDGVAIMRRDASHAATTSYTPGMLARLEECRTNIVGWIEDSKRTVCIAESCSSGSTVRRHVELAKLRADLERVIQMFNGQNKICVGSLPPSAALSASQSVQPGSDTGASHCSHGLHWCRIVGLERRSGSRRTVGSGVGPDPRTSDSDCSSDLHSTMSPLALGSPAVAPQHQHQVVRRLNSWLGDASRGSTSSTRWWSGFVRSPTVSSGSNLSIGHNADREQSSRCACPGACAATLLLLAAVLLCLLVLVKGCGGAVGRNGALSSTGRPHTNSLLLDKPGSEGGGQEPEPSMCGSFGHWLVHVEMLAPGV